MVGPSGSSHDVVADARGGEGLSSRQHSHPISAGGQSDVHGTRSHQGMSDVIQALLPQQPSSDGAVTENMADVVDSSGDMACGSEAGSGIFDISGRQQSAQDVASTEGSSMAGKRRPSLQSAADVVAADSLAALHGRLQKAMAGIADVI